LLLALDQQLLKDLLVQLPGAVLIGISQGGTVGGGDSQVFSFPLAAPKAAGNFSEGMSPAQLAKEHGHELAPASEPPGMSLGFGFLDCLLEIGPGKEL